jgi:mono/diheme cytochrome c family protein
VTKKMSYFLAACSLIVVLCALVWINRNTPALSWRKELLKIKLSGALPSERWPTVIRRMLASSDSANESLDGLRLDAVGASPSAISEGAVYFERYCAGCHGLKGGGGEVGVNLSGRSAQSELSDLEIYRAVTRGRGSEMPVITQNVQQALRITAYVRSLGSRSENESPTVK